MSVLEYVNTFHSRCLSFVPYCSLFHAQLGVHDRVVVHSVTIARDGGILDWDDLVREVLDDREQVSDATPLPPSSDPFCGRPLTRGL